MLKADVKKSFGLRFRPMIKFVVLLFIGLFCTTIPCLAQEKTIQGIVFDNKSKERLSRVFILNTRTGLGNYNNLKGEFTIDAQVNDVLITSKTGYKNDTLTVSNENLSIIYLQRTSIVLNEVSIRDSVLTPEKKLEATKEEFSKIYGSLANRDLLSMGNGQSGAGLSIDALYNIFSKQGKNARKLEKIINRDYRENIIDYKFNRGVVGKATGLKDPQLTDFMQKYRPGYYFIISASEYDLVSYIRSSLIRYERNPDALTLPALIPNKN